jgi:hypothetical protein
MSQTTTIAISLRRKINLTSFNPRSTSVDPLWHSRHDGHSSHHFIKIIFAGTEHVVSIIVAGSTI